MACFYSSAIEGEISQILGLTHYSYRFAEQKFRQLFEDFGLQLVKLPMPEYYGSRDALIGPDSPDPGLIAHLIFRSTEQIRLLKFGYNIGCFAWEFEVLKDDTRPSEHPFLNQHRMLSLCDELWVPCTFTRDVLARHGIDNVHVIPAPIAIPIGPRPDRDANLVALGHVGVVPLIINILVPQEENTRLCAARSQAIIDWLPPRLQAEDDPLVYLTVLNPDDYRKNLDALLRGFFYFQKKHPEACLIVKVLVGSERASLPQVVAGNVRHKLADGTVFDTENIVFLSRFLSEEEMSALFCLADFYLCTALAEGQNLPLLEAMAHGTIPVTTCNTAMGDYITPSNAFQIAEREVSNISPDLAGTVAGKPFSIHSSGARDVFEALMRSRAATPKQRREMAEACVASVRSQFSPAAVWPRVQRRLAVAAGQRPRLLSDASA